jgi:hypothetical protein
MSIYKSTKNILQKLGKHAPNEVIILHVLRDTKEWFTRDYLIDYVNNHKGKTSTGTAISCALTNLLYEKKIIRSKNTKTYRGGRGNAIYKYKINEQP